VRTIRELWTLDELDRPYTVEREPPYPPVTMPAQFDAMTDERRRGWPNRVVAHWALGRSWLAVLPILIGPAAWWLTGSVPTGIGAAGLVLDIIGVWLLTEGLILSHPKPSNRLARLESPGVTPVHVRSVR
jgi:hypothetical protein